MGTASIYIKMIINGQPKFKLPDVTSFNNIKEITTEKGFESMFHFESPPASETVKIDDEDDDKVWDEHGVYPTDGCACEFCVNFDKYMEEILNERNLYDPYCEYDKFVGDVTVSWHETGAFTSTSFDTRIGTGKPLQAFRDLDEYYSKEHPDWKEGATFEITFPKRFNETEAVRIIARAWLTHRKHHLESLQRFVENPRSTDIHARTNEYGIDSKHEVNSGMLVYVLGEAIRYRFNAQEMQTEVGKMKGILLQKMDEMPYPSQSHQKNFSHFVREMIFGQARQMRLKRTDRQIGITTLCEMILVLKQMNVRCLRFDGYIGGAIFDDGSFLFDEDPNPLTKEILKYYAKESNLHINLAEERKEKEAEMEAKRWLKEVEEARLKAEAVALVRADQEKSRAMVEAVRAHRKAKKRAELKVSQEIAKNKDFEARMRLEMAPVKNPPPFDLDVKSELKKKLEAENEECKRAADKARRIVEEARAELKAKKQMEKKGKGKK